MKTELTMRPLRTHAKAARALGFELLWRDEIVGRWGSRGKIFKFTVRLEPRSRNAIEALRRMNSDGIESATTYRSDDDQTDAVLESGDQAIAIAASVMT